MQLQTAANTGHLQKQNEDKFVYIFAIGLVDTELGRLLKCLSKHNKPFTKIQKKKKHHLEEESKGPVNKGSTGNVLYTELDG